MTYMLTRIAVEDYEAWKEMFDEGREGVRAEATGHRILRSVDVPDELFIQVEFPTADQARAAREALLASGVLDRVTVKSEPSIAEPAEQVRY